MYIDKHINVSVFLEQLKKAKAMQPTDSKGTSQAQKINRIYASYTREAVTLLGQMIRIARIEQKMSVKDLAERVGVSRDLMQRIEKGDLRCGIGLVFEAATIVGVPLFEANNPKQLTQFSRMYEDKIKLLPKAVHAKKTLLKDDF